MGNTRDTGYLQNLVTYDASGNIVLPANLTVNGNLLVATQSYVTTQISNLINGAPALLDTLDELAAALGDDASFASTITTSIAGKQAQLNGTGFVKVTGTTISYDNSTYLTTSSATSTYLPLAGGTLTGALNGISASFSSTITASSTGGSGLRIYGAAGTNQWDIYLNSTNLRFSDNTGTGSVVFDRPINSSTLTVKGTSIGAGLGKLSVYAGGDENTWNATRNEAIRIGRADVDGSFYHSIWSATGSGVDETAHWLRFYISNANGSSQTLAMTMNGNGNVGIGGITSPGEKLEVNGNINAQIINSTSNAFRFSGNNALSLVSLNSQNVVKINAAGYWGSQIVGANDQGLLINNSGNVGIGTVSPFAKLEVVGGNNLPPSTGTQNYTIALRDPTSMVANVGGSILFQGFKTSTSAIGNFAYIAGKKENGTAGNEAGYLSIGTFDSSGIPEEQIRVTSGGNTVFGGSAGSGWSTASGRTTLEIYGSIYPTALHNSSSVGTSLSYNTYWDGANWRFVQGGSSVIYIQDSEGHKFLHNSSGTEGASFTPIERMRIRANGGISVAGANSYFSMDGAGLAGPPSGLGYGLYPHSGIGLGYYSVAVGHVWYVTATPVSRMYLTSNNLFVGPQQTTTYPERLNVAGGLRVHSGNEWDGLGITADGTRVYYNATGAEDDMQFQFFGATRFTLFVNGNYSFVGSNVSDARLKNSISSITTSYIEKINQLELSTFKMNSETNGAFKIGFIAQHVKTILPEVVTGDETKPHEYLGVDTNGLLALTIKALQELKAENDLLKARLDNNNII